MASKIAISLLQKGRESKFFWGEAPRPPFISLHPILSPHPLSDLSAVPDSIQVEFRIEQNKNKIGIE